jgi:hypothetical protein
MSFKLCVKYLKLPHARHLNECKKLLVNTHRKHMPPENICLYLVVKFVLLNVQVLVYVLLTINIACKIVHTYIAYFIISMGTFLLQHVTFTCRQCFVCVSNLAFLYVENMFFMRSSIIHCGS